MTRSVSEVDSLMSFIMAPNEFRLWDVLDVSPLAFRDMRLQGKHWKILSKFWKGDKL